MVTDSPSDNELFAALVNELRLQARGRRCAPRRDGRGDLRPADRPRAASPGRTSRGRALLKRQVRLPRDLDAQLVRYANEHELALAEVIREAIADYLRSA